MMDQITLLSAKQLVKKIRERQFSAEEVICAYLEKINKVNPSLNAIVQLNATDALLQARAIDRAYLKGGHGGQLLGVPVTIKNACHVKGFAPDKGCQGLVGSISTVDATVVARLRHEGAVIIGLTNTPEFSIGYETDNLVYGKTCNPYQLDRTPGGSSGGEAAILGAGASALGIGSDASGSIRVPAHNTGIAALKATQGRIPFTGSVPLDAAGLFSQFISFGPMARYVEDIALVLPIIAGSDDRDPHAVPVPLRDPELVDLTKLRVAYYADDGLATPTEDIIETIKQAAMTLKSVVALIAEDRPVVLQEVDGLLADSIFLGGDEGKWLVDILERLRIKEPSPLLQEFLALAKSCKFSVTELRLCWQKLDLYRHKMLKFLDNYDIIICPVAATPAKRHGLSFKEIRDFSYSMCYTLVNWPVAVVRCGTSGEGLPIGIQIIGKPWREDTVLATAAYLEKSLGGWQSPVDRVLV